MPANTGLWLTGLLLTGLFLPLATLVIGSFTTLDAQGNVARWGLQNYLAAGTEPVGLGAIGASLCFALGASLLACLLGAGMAWLHERTDLPWRRALAALTLAPLFVPGVLYAYAWILLASPQIGMLNLATALLPGSPRPFDIYGYPGMIWVEALRSAPMAFLLVAAMLRSLDPARELAAQLAGASLSSTLRRITLPMLLPALGATFLLSFIRAVGAFEIPAMLGTPAGIEVFSSRIYRAYQDNLGDIGPAAAESVPLLVLALLLLAIHEGLVKPRLKHAASGFGHNTNLRVRLGRARLPIGLTLASLAALCAVLPLLAIIWSSLSPFFAAPGAHAFSQISLDGYRHVLGSAIISAAGRRTLTLSAAAASLIMAGSLLVAWVIERTRTRARHLLEPAIDLLIAVPGVLMGVAILLFHTWFDTGWYGTSLLLLLAYTTKHLPQGLRFARSGLNQIPRELEFAALSAGASPAQSFFRITLPLLVPGLIAGWLYVAMLCARELSSALLLYVPGEQVLAVLLWEYWQNGQIMNLSALSVLFVLPLLGMAVLAWTLSPRPR